METRLVKQVEWLSVIFVCWEYWWKITHFYIYLKDKDFVIRKGKAGGTSFAAA